MAYKLSFWLVLFLALFQAGATMLTVSGAAAWLAIDPNVCAQNLQGAGALQAYQTGSGEGSTLFGLYSSIAGPLEATFDDVFSGRVMLKCAGVPSYIVNFGFAALVFIPGRDLIKFLRSG